MGQEDQYKYCGVKILWQWNWRLWSWFTSHGVESAYYGAEHVASYCYNCGCTQGYRMSKAPNKVFDRIYHFGPLKIFVGVIK